MSKRQFCWQCVKFAFRGGWVITDIISVLFGVFAGLIVWRWAPLGAIVNILVWVIPLGVFLLAVVLGLIFAPYKIYKNQEKQTQELEGELNNIKTMIPNFVLRKIDESYYGNVITTWQSENVVQHQVEHPYFTRIWVANEPIEPKYGVDAQYVYGEIEFWDEPCQNRLFYMGGRWAETKEIAQDAQPIEIEQITIPPNGRPYCMDIGLKYQGEEEFYGYNNETPRKNTKGFRDPDRKLGKGFYFVKTRFRCKGIDTSFWFKLENPGEDKNVKFIPSSKPSELIRES